ncbi:MAG TPA: formyltransferase [Casimicrobiaceae bacterium]|nr:formyltransferase [Casimicrobiaceae bacterium]
MRAVVFAYHNVGARCLRVLCAHGVEVPLVVTHEDDPSEVQWFERVADVADEAGLPWTAPVDVNVPEEIARISALRPDFVFSFYYRRMLASALLALPRRGALNMHGSLLPKYRGRAPVNWAVLNGERQTGATLHYMIDKPDAGDIVAQQAVPILPDDTAQQVFDKVTVAAEICLDGVLPALLAGTARRYVNDLAHGSYYGGRTPDDGRIDWSKSAREIHNLVRAVAPPYPGAFTDLAGMPARILRTRLLDADAAPAAPKLGVQITHPQSRDGTPAPRRAMLVAHCGGGGTLRVDALEIAGQACDVVSFRARFGEHPVAPG